MQPSICLSQQCYPYGGSGRATDQTPSHALMLATKEEAHTGGTRTAWEEEGMPAWRNASPQAGSGN